MGRPRSRVSVLALALLVVTVAVGSIALGGARSPHGTEGPAARCQRFAEDAGARAAATPAADADLVVIGDSWSVGLGLPDADAAWPSRLPGRVHVEGFSGSGYGALASRCGRVSFADRAGAAVAGTPSGVPVVVEGGLNDWDSTDAQIIDGFERLMSALHGHPVLIVGPAAAPARAPFMGRVSALLAGLSARAGVRYLPTSDLSLVYQPDGLHPTAAGAALFGDAVADAVRTLG